MSYLRLALAAALAVGFLWLRFHWIEVGRNEVRIEVEKARLVEAQRQDEAQVAALQDALKRIEQLTKANSELEAALNSSEVLNHAEADTPCLSDARRLRIEAVR